MANVRFIKTKKERYVNRDTYDDTALYFCEDTQEMFWGNRIISDGARVIPTYADLPECLGAADGVIYYTEDTKNGYMINPERTAWLQVVYAPVTDINSIPEEDKHTVAATVGAVQDVKEELTSYIDEQVMTGGTGILDGGEV